MIHIRPEKPRDLAAIYHVNERALGHVVEAQFVEEPRARQKMTLLLVAVQNGYVLGHILFSPVTIDSGRYGTRRLDWGPSGLVRISESGHWIALDRSC